MRVKVIGEYGYEQAIFGIGLSYGLTSGLTFENFTGDDHIINKESPYMRCKKVAEKLAFRDGGHNKALEHISVWLDVFGPRYWWQEFDTYRVGTSKQSESTIHTIMKRELTQDDFEGEIYGCVLHALNADIESKLFDEVKNALPEGFLQRRIVATNYKVLRNMILQRRKHKLPQWQTFIAEVLAQVQQPELLPGLYE